MQDLRMAHLCSEQNWGLCLLGVLTLIKLCLCQGDTANTIYYQLEEEEPVGKAIGNLVRDSTLDIRYTPDVIAKLHFQFLSDPGISIHIDYDTGMLSTNGRVDRESIMGCTQHEHCEVTLDIAVQPITYFQIFKVIIEVIDINDNAPIFDQRLYEHSLKESASLGSSFIVPSASDKDSPKFGVQTYELHSDMNLEPFVLEVTEKQDGTLGIRIKLTQALDREIQDQYTLSLWAYDGGDMPNSAAMEIMVSVEDSNDNDPLFENSSYEVTVPEDVPVGSTVIQVIATDQDTEENGRIQYMFSAQTSSLYGEIFGLDVDSGAVFLRKKLDHENVKVYNLMVTAQDMGPDSQPTDTNVVIHVEDTNDNAPIITVNTLSSGANSAEIPEDSPVSTFVAHVTVTDPDSGMNGRYNCSLTDNAFRLQATEFDTEYQIFTTVELDREIMPEYNLALICLDHGQNPQRAVRNIRVTVTDVNDNAPEFSRQSYTANIIENSYQGAVVITVRAIDRDVGDNAEVHYSLPREVTDIFDINRRTGTITAKALIDHEVATQYRFYVVATDSGSPSQSTSASVMVMVEDVNDEKPVFTESAYIFSVRENEEPGTLVGTVTATDADSPPYNEFFFSLIHSGASTKAFMMDPKSGRLMLRERLDRETQNVYHIAITAKDSSGLTDFSSTARVTINVADENDNNPIFDFPTTYNNTVHISNQVPVGYNFSRVRAHDLDIGRNGQIAYEIQSGNSDDLFTIDSETGILYTNIKMNSFEYKVTKLQMIAKDHGSPEPRFQLMDLNVIVNRSIPYLPYGQAPAGMLSNQNLMIVISVACGCAVVAVILVIAIICIHRRDKLQRERQYNCRIEAIGRLTTKEVIGQDGKVQCHQDVEKKPLDHDLKNVSDSDKKITTISGMNGSTVSKLSHSSQPSGGVLPTAVPVAKDVAALEVSGTESMSSQSGSDSGCGVSDEGGDRSQRVNNHGSGELHHSDAGYQRVNSHHVGYPRVKDHNAVYLHDKEQDVGCPRVKEHEAGYPRVKEYDAGCSPVHSSPIQYQVGYSSLRAHSAATNSYNSYSQPTPQFNTFSYKHTPHAHGNHHPESPLAGYDPREGKSIHPKSVRVLPSSQRYGEVSWGGIQAHSPSNQKPLSHKQKDTITYENGDTPVTKGVLV